jgi:hypothetical protein
MRCALHCFVLHCRLGGCLLEVWASSCCMHSWGLGCVSECGCAQAYALEEVPSFGGIMQLQSLWAALRLP